MSTRRSGNWSSLAGGAALLTAVAGLVGVAARAAAEDARQVAVRDAVLRLPGVADAIIDVHLPFLPWGSTRVTGSVALSAPGVEEFETLFDECVVAARGAMDQGEDYTADIELVADPVHAPTGD